MSTKNKTDIVLGPVELSEDEFASQNVKVRVTTMIDEDALLSLKKIAAEKGMKYQTLLNRIVRAYVAGPAKERSSSIALNEQKVREIVRQELRKRKA